MTDHITGRNAILQALRRELVGPSTFGKEIDCSTEVKFETRQESYGPWKQAGSGEEILVRDNPCKRYGVGVLYPIGSGSSTQDGQIDQDQAADAEAAVESSSGPETVTEEAIEQIDKMLNAASAGGETDEEHSDSGVSGANARNPSSMGISFLAECGNDSKLVIEISGGRYLAKKVIVAGQERTWWLREAVAMRAEFPHQSLCAAEKHRARPSNIVKTNAEGLDLSIEVFARPYGLSPNLQLITVCVVNRTAASVSASKSSLFQTYITAFLDGNGHVLPYPTPPQQKLDEEEESLSLLYRKVETYAVGHGCAADWEADADNRRAGRVTGSCLPSYETPSITPDIIDKNGQSIEVKMAQLAGLVEGDNGFKSLNDVVRNYKHWISDAASEIPTLDARFHSVAKRHIEECRTAAKRMEEGLEYLRSNELARRAFQLANHAMLLQQVRTYREPRMTEFDWKSNRLIFKIPYRHHDLLNPGQGKGAWRAFQIAFLLMSVRSVGDGQAPDRSMVELIWFPTGGGKTEAYLGLSAFLMFLRRLEVRQDSGVDVLMRYTLRLLTAQQFQRASALICAMEHIRRECDGKLGEKEFSIGIWVGSTSTPNLRSEGILALRALQKGDPSAENPFVLTRCPWCGAEMGCMQRTVRLPKGVSRVLGFRQVGTTVVLLCPDIACPFSASLPIYVIDEDIYERRPSLIIGTVDKFAMLAWQPKARALFGLNDDGGRDLAPPGLIVQDELHLISGPLGSMVGLYEAVIEELCTDRRQKKPLIPKIISSTATIRRYKHQIKSLYGRRDVCLFPPPGLEAGDSFFARYARTREGKLMRGRLYVGVHAPALGSLQTAQVRTFTSLLQSPVGLGLEERDPWWTLLLFFNSLRELGTTLSLFQSDIPNYFKIMRIRDGIDYQGLRHVWEPKELTGRIRSDEVPQAIAELEVPTTSIDKRPVDVCLASNIIEVGIDIDRLSLMSVVGQPKTTSQYIQVTGRIGRKWEERPGLVVTIYVATKPRDRSHFEKFRSYHERLYAQVEPTSVTPFSPPVLDRALHAVLVSYARQANSASTATSPYPYPPDVIDAFRRLLLPRVETVDKEEVSNFERVLERRSAEWRRWQRTKWKGGPQEQDPPLLRDPGQYAVPAWAKVSWPTPTSMRNVDAECQAEITHLYLTEKSEDV